MPLSTTPAQRRAELARVERRLTEIQDELLTLEGERATLKGHLENLRRSLTICPKCGSDRDFLADEGGVLIHVLEDPEDTDLLTDGKPLFCSRCGEVFLYQAQPQLVAVTRRR